MFTLTQQTKMTSTSPAFTATCHYFAFPDFVSVSLDLTKIADVCTFQKESVTKTQPNVQVRAIGKPWENARVIFFSTYENALIAKYMIDAAVVSSRGPGCTSVAPPVSGTVPVAAVAVDTEKSQSQLNRDGCNYHYRAATTLLRFPRGPELHIHY